jgi:hypothetical protein
LELQSGHQLVLVLGHQLVLVLGHWLEPRLELQSGHQLALGLEQLLVLELNFLDKLSPVANHILSCYCSTQVHQDMA